MSVGGWAEHGGGEVNSRQLMALFQVMYDPHQSTTVIKPVQKGVKKRRKIDGSTKLMGRGVGKSVSVK